MNYSRKELLAALALAQDCPWSSATLEQCHASAACTQSQSFFPSLSKVLHPPHCSTFSKHHCDTQPTEWEVALSHHGALLVNCPGLDPGSNANLHNAPAIGPSAPGTNALHEHPNPILKLINLLLDLSEFMNLVHLDLICILLPLQWTSRFQNIITHCKILKVVTPT